MCEICHSSPCLNLCPNALAPKAAFICGYCEEPIYPGDEYAKIDCERYHIDCLDGMAASDLLNLFGVDTFTATDDDIYDGFDG